MNFGLSNMTMDQANGAPNALRFALLASVNGRKTKTTKPTNKTMW